MPKTGVAVKHRCSTGVAALSTVLDSVSNLPLHRYTAFRPFPYAREIITPPHLLSHGYREMPQNRCSGVAATQERRTPREKRRYTAATPPLHHFKKQAINPVQHAKTAILGAV